jgi:hypothetical protein
MEYIQDLFISIREKKFGNNIAISNELAPWGIDWRS